MTEKEKQVSFAGFGDVFQDRVVQALIHDIDWAEQMLDILVVEYFDLNHLSFIVSKYYKYYQKYRTFPSLDILATVLSESLDQSKIADDALITSIRKFLKKTKNNPDLNDLSYVKEKAFQFCKTQAMKSALEKSVDLIAQDKLDSVLEVMKTAMMAGETADLGHDFDEDEEERFNEELREPIPIGIPELDDENVLRGGLAKGKLGLFIAPSGVGKSHFLVQAGASGRMNGYNVVHYTLEMDKIECGHRYDAHITGIDNRDIVKKKEEVKQTYKQLKEDGKNMGRLFIKKYPSGFPTANTFLSHIKKLEIKKKVKIDLIIVDYAGEMKSIENFDSSEGRHKRRAVLRDLRNLAEELKVPIWTAIQSNREGSQSEVITGDNAAEGFSQLDIPDVVLTGACKQTDKATGAIMAFLNKQRGGKDGLHFPMFVDKSTSKFYVISRDKYIELTKSAHDDENDIKRKLRSRLKTDVKKDIIDNVGAVEV